MCDPDTGAPDKRVVFISGPFRAPTPWGIEQNVRMAEEVALEVWRAGAVAVCPHTNSRFFQGAIEDEEVWLLGYLELLSRCDAVRVVPGWEGSEGARAEIEFARLLKIPVLHTSMALDTWLASPLAAPPLAGRRPLISDVIRDFIAAKDRQREVREGERPPKPARRVGPFPTTKETS